MLEQPYFVAGQNHVGGYSDESFGNPVAFYFTATDPYDWTSPQNADLWQDGAKTLFDPCPAGWRVPLGGPDGHSAWNAFSLDNSVWNGADTDPLGGRTFDNSVVQSGSTWYPASGSRDYQHFPYLSWIGSWGFVWSTAARHDRYWIFRFNSARIDSGGGVYKNRSFGLSVRCVRG